MSSPQIPHACRKGSVICVSEDDVRVARPTALYPRPEITPSEFEEFVADQLLAAAAPQVSDLAVTVHEKVVGADGAYDFDATVRYRFAGMAFLVVVEAKLHRNPIKRELVQVLRQKIQSVGAHKGVMVSTSPYQTGAVEFAKAHGIALVTVTEGRFVFETRAMAPRLHSSAGEDGWSRGPYTFVAHYHGPDGQSGWTDVWLLSPDDEEYPCHVADLLLGRPSR
jgi:Restriction endonuclease